MPDQELMPETLRDLTARLQALLDERSAPLVGRLVDVAFDMGRQRGVEDMKAVVDEHLA